MCSLGLCLVLLLCAEPLQPLVVNAQALLLEVVEYDWPDPPQVGQPLDQPVGLVGRHHRVCPDAKLSLPAWSITPEQLVKNSTEVHQPAISPQVVLRLGQERIEPSIAASEENLLGHNALIPSVPYTDFEILNLTSQTVFIVFLGLLYDFGATPIPCFVDYFTVEPSRAKSHFTQSSLKDVCKYFSLIFNRFVTKLLLLTKATLLQW